jgi:hypothetical protein
MSHTVPCSKCGAPYEPMCWQAPVGDEWWCADCVWRDYLRLEKQNNTIGDLLKKRIELLELYIVLELEPQSKDAPAVATAAAELRSVLRQIRFMENNPDKED